MILEIESDGNRKIRFTPTKAIETQAAMQQLVYAFIDELSEFSDKGSMTVRHFDGSTFRQAQ